MTDDNDNARPFVTVVIEGYNEAHDLGTADDTVRALRRQDFPLGRVSLTLVGTSAQARAWGEWYKDPAPFRSIEVVAADEANYYQLKNVGAELSQAEVVAFTDSDAVPYPGWLTAIAEGFAEGADVVVGPSLFRSRRLAPESALMLAAASISWGFVARVKRQSECGGFLSHNLAVRSEVFSRSRYREDLGRTCGSPLLYRALAESGSRFAFKPGQKVAHTFKLGWWLRTFHFRSGYEVYRVRRLDRSYPNQWIARTGPAEPFVTMLWHILLDIPQWLRFGKLLRLGRARRLLLLPVVVALAVPARAAEMVGMYCTMLAPRRMRLWAESS